MNQHEILSLNAKLGIKAIQNLAGSLKAFERMEALFTHRDDIGLSSLFSFGVIKYAKMFIESSTAFGKRTYPIRHLKIEPNFSTEMHKHLVEIRNTLIAHDDFESVEPKILQGCMGLNDGAIIIPVMIGVSNLCISYPEDLATINKMKCHVAAALQAAMKKLDQDLMKMRALSISNPELAMCGIKFKKDYGSKETPVQGEKVFPPDFMNEQWLNPDAPDFSNVHNGFRYESLKIQKQFNQHETIKLPNGDFVTIEPHPKMPNPSIKQDA